MSKSFLFFLFLCTSILSYSQNEDANVSKEKPEKPPITLYKITSVTCDTTFIDTSLSIQKEYKFNYLRKDNFNLQAFANVGQTYNTLVYDFDRTNLIPLFAAQSHHFNYLDIEDINYYHMPTPLTELYFKTAFKQGQQLDAFFTINTSEQFNFSIAYKGLRSLGSYQHSLVSNGNLRITSNYQSKNNWYTMITHFTAQDMLNEENGGLTDNSILLFTYDNPDFRDRGLLDVNFENAENKLEGIRIYSDQEYKLITKKDNTDQNLLTIGSIINYEDKFYRYIQDIPFAGFGESYVTSDLNKKVTFENFNIQGYSRFENKVFGKLKAFIGYTDYNYGYNSVLYLDDGTITNRIKGNVIQTSASYKKEYKGFQLYGEGAINISGNLDANYLKVGASYSIQNEHRVSAELKTHSVAPNFNFLLYQSDYINYNWQTNFNNEKTQQLLVKLESNKIVNTTVSYTGIDDYTYFAIKINDSTPTPHQYIKRVDYIKVKLQKEFRYKKFGLENTILYQEALSGDEVLNIPQFITRNTLYFQDELFKKALFIQTGVRFKYYASYTANAYDPVLAEFYVQHDQKLGSFPLVDLFFNAKVKQTRFYFKYENFTSLFSSTNEYFAAPDYPYRDAVIRFGIVWNFFL